MTRRWNPLAALVVFATGSWLVIAALVALVWWWVA